MLEPKIKILYIDDELLNLTAFKRLFRKHYNITTASSAAEGREILKSFTFHIILVDQRMPGTTGSEFFKEVSSIYPDSMRLLVTAYSDLNAVISAVNEGQIFKYISKPYSKDQMMGIIEEAYKVYCLRETQSYNYSKYENVFTNSNDAIFLVNMEGVLVDANESCLELFGKKREEFLDTEAEDLLFKRLILKNEIPGDFLSNVPLDDSEVVFLNNDGEKTDCLFSLKEIYSETNQPIGYQGIIKNIGEYAKNVKSSLRGLLEERERENGSLVSVIHENSAQNLSGLSFQLGLLEKQQNSDLAKETVKTVKEVLKGTILELREVCFKILPKSLEAGIGDALEELTFKISGAYDTYFNLVVEEELSCQSKEFRIMIFRTIQGLIKSLEKENGYISIEISSDDYCVYSEVMGTPLDSIDETLKQVAVEVDCYNGSINPFKAVNDMTNYRMVFPLKNL